MVQTKRYSSILVVGVAVLATSVGTAHAFSMAGAANRMQSQSKGAVAAYTQGDNAGDSDDLLLSPAEVSHIKWCATQYPSYHPTDDTFATKAGNRAPCRSPN